MKLLQWDEVIITKDYEINCSGVFDEAVDPSEVLGAECMINVYGVRVIVVITDIVDWRKWHAIDRKRAVSG